MPTLDSPRSQTRPCSCSRARALCCRSTALIRTICPCTATACASSSAASCSASPISLSLAAYTYDDVVATIQSVAACASPDPPCELFCSSLYPATVSPSSAPPPTSSAIRGVEGHFPSRMESFLRYPALLRLGQHMDPLPDIQPIRPGPAAEPGGPRPAQSTKPTGRAPERELGRGTAGNPQHIFTSGGASLG